jgi:hypothetical protein
MPPTLLFIVGAYLIAALITVGVERRGGRG